MTCPSVGLAYLDLGQQAKYTWRKGRPCQNQVMGEILFPVSRIEHGKSEGMEEHRLLCSQAESESERDANELKSRRLFAEEFERERERERELLGERANRSHGRKARQGVKKNLFDEPKGYHAKSRQSVRSNLFSIKVVHQLVEKNRETSIDKNPSWNLKVSLIRDTSVLYDLRLHIRDQLGSSRGK